MDSMMAGEPQWKYCSTPDGRPAVEKALVTCSATVGVWGEGLRMTVLPARRAGIKAFTRIK
jgi:hypothetical protein